MNTVALPKLVVCVAFLFSLSGCLTMSGNYTVTAVDANGTPAKSVFHTEGHGIYPVRNAFCMNYPKGTVTIRDTGTGEELKSESPYHCR